MEVVVFLLVVVEFIAVVFAGQLDGDPDVVEQLRGGAELQHGGVGGETVLPVGSPAGHGRRWRGSSPVLLYRHSAVPMRRTLTNCGGL